MIWLKQNQMYLPLHILFILPCIHICSSQMFYVDEDNDTSINLDFVPRVVNGWPAKLGDVPYQIAFKKLISRARKLYMTFCGGVIIQPNKLMSAAHCFEEKGSKCFNRGKVSRRFLDKVVAVAGNLLNRAVGYKDGQWRRLKSMYYPKSYKFPKDDICVGHTTEPFIVNEHVAPIPFARKNIDYTGKCLVSGYGRTSRIATAEVLLLAHLELVEKKKCNRMHFKNMRNFVCTSSVTTDVGKGDSGGPLVCSGTGEPQEISKGILVGIVSGQRLRVGSFFTRVSSYTRFIERNKGSYLKPSLILVWFNVIYGSIVLSLFCFI